VVFTNTGGRGARVVTSSRWPEEQGVRPGLPLAEAQLLAGDHSPSPLGGENFQSPSPPWGEGLGVRSGPSVCPQSTPPTHFEPHDPAADVAALRRLALESQQFAPLVGVEDADAPQCLLLDASGCTHLFGGEQSFVETVARHFRERGLSARVALAPTIGAAWGAARWVARPRAPVVVPLEHLASLLSHLPAAALRLSEATVETLRELGLHSIGQVKQLPRSGLPSRLGHDVMRRLDQAFGDAPEVLTVERASPPIEATWAGEEPLADRAMLVAICRQLVSQIVGQLAARGEGVQRLVCRAAGAAGRRAEWVVNLVIPCEAAAHLVELLRLQLERAALPDDVSHVSLTASATAPLGLRQRDLFGDEVNPDRDRELGALLNRLSSRLGPRAVLRPRVVPDAQPEFAAAVEPWLESDAAARSTAADGFAGGTRPLRLLTPPEAISVRVAGPEAVPVRFCWQRREHRVVRSWGPERIETGWWRDAHVRRDYFRVEVHSGHWFWLFHCLTEHDWFLHGAFD